jgi:hypothetical protein
MFLTKWKGYEGLTWEPVNHFFHRYSSDFIEYCHTAEHVDRSAEADLAQP